MNVGDKVRKTKGRDVKGVVRHVYEDGAVEVKWEDLEYSVFYLQTEVSELIEIDVDERRA